MTLKKMKPAWNRRTAAMAALAMFAAICGPSQMTAAQAAVPTVTITAQSGNASSSIDCKGVFRSEVSSPIRLTISRDGDTSGSLTVALTYQGTLAATSGLPATVTIPAGSSEVELTAAEAAVGTLSTGVTQSPDYVVADPGSVSTGVSSSIGDLGCNIGNVLTEQTVTLGSQPADVDVVTTAYGPPADLERSVEGAVPPGTTFNLDGTWEGTTTELGVFFFREYFCEDDGWCPYRADIRVTVVPAAEVPQPHGPVVEAPPRPSATPAPPANPIEAAANYTG